MTRLFLCEKPAQARDIAAALGARSRGDGCLRGRDLIVTWCVGHLLEMDPPEAYGEDFKCWRLETLPILPKRWKLHPRKGAGKQLKIIGRLLKEACEVVVATDADREGETIAREVLDRFGWQGPVLRLWLSALDEASIRKALGNLLPGEKTRPLYLAGLARARADWMVGMNLTRAYTVLGRSRGHDGVLSVGRVQTPTLRLVVDRDRESEAFRPKPYWEVVCAMEPEQGDRTFMARWGPPGEAADAEGRCINERAARTVARKVSGRRGTVVKAETRRVREAPPLPFDLGTLQQEASRRWGMGAQQVLDIAQALYETHKATTYPRTDCPYLPESMLAEVDQVLKAMRRSDPRIATLVERADRTLRSRAWNDAKISAHHAIIPTVAACDPSRMNEEEFKLYDLIRRRYLAQFYPRHEYDQTTLLLDVESERFKASGRRVAVQGWRVLFGQEPREDGGVDGNQEIPLLREGSACGALKADVLARQTKPPVRFTEGTLIAAMKNVAKLITDERLRQVLKETSGLGTEATRAGIIKTLLERGFLQKRKKNLISTETGRALIDALPEPVKDPGTTALWEQALDDIAEGRGRLEEFVQRQADWVATMVERAKENGAIGGISPQQRLCHECGKPLRRRKGKSGFFWGCTGYPDCQVTLPDDGGKPARRGGETLGKCRCGGDVFASPKAWQCKSCNSIVWKESFGKKLTQTQAAGLLAGKTVQLRGLLSKSGKKYDAHARIENGKLTLLFGGAPSQSASTSRSVDKKASTGDTCPECGKGKLIQRVIKSGKNEGRPFLGCARYPKCRYFAWMPQR